MNLEGWPFESLGGDNKLGEGKPPGGGGVPSYLIWVNNHSIRRI